MFFIYMITNLQNNKIYIGQTTNPSQRWSQHKSNAKYHIDKLLVTRAMIKYGVTNFSFEVIATCKTLNDANYIETYIIAQQDSRNKKIGYNIERGGGNMERSPEIGEKISERLLEYYKTHDGTNKGKKLSEEHKAKLSVAATGKPGTNLGKKFSPEHKEKISQSLIGKPLSPEHIQKLSDSHVGQIAPNRKLTLEQAEEIRKEYAQGNVSRKLLGKKYNISQDSVFNIIHYITYVNRSQ